MTTSATKTTAMTVTESLEALATEVVRLTGKARSDNTLHAYEGDWTRFASWCADQGLESMPAVPGTVALYLAHLHQQGAKVSTIQRAAASISVAHKTQGLDSPTRHAGVCEVLKGIRNDKGVAKNKKAPVTFEDLRTLLAHVPSTPTGIRDRAILTLGFFTASRRSELVGLDVSDVAFTPKGIVVTVRHSKTDQEGRGIKKAVHLQVPDVCPFAAVKAWLQVLGANASGALFRAIDQHGHISPERMSDRAVALIVKRYATAAGLDADLFSGHSLRRGLATSAAQRGAGHHEIMKTTGHKKADMVNEYIDDAELFAGNVTMRFNGMAAR